MSEIFVAYGRKIMTDVYFPTWCNFMDSKTFLLFIHTLSLVHTDKNSTIIYKNFVDEPIVTSTIEGTLLSADQNDNINVSHTRGHTLLDEVEFRTTGNESGDQRHDVTGIHKGSNGQENGDADGKRSTTMIVEQFDTNEDRKQTSTSLQRIEDYDESPTYDERHSTTSSTTSSSLTMVYHRDSMKSSSTPYNRLNTARTDKNSENIINLLVHSFVNGIWRLFYRPFFSAIGLTSLHSFNSTQNVNGSESETENLPPSSISSYSDTGITTVITPIESDSKSLSTRVIHEKSFLHVSTTSESPSASEFNADMAMENITAPHETITTVLDSIKSINDSLVSEIDTSISSTTEKITDEQTQHSDSRGNMKDMIMQNLYNVKNNSLNKDASLIFMNMMIEKYNNSKIRRPFSSVYSRVHKVLPDMQRKTKREISSNMEYNPADRQELVSYFYNDRKFRENYPNLATSNNQNTPPSDIYSSDQLYNRPNFYSQPIPPIYMQNQDNPSREFYDGSSKFDSSVANHFQNDLNDSSLLYLIDKFGYSIFDNAESKTTSTETNIEDDSIDLKYREADQHSDELQEEFDTRKKPKKITAYERRSDSAKRMRNKTRRRTKARSGRMKISRKKGDRENGRSSSKYLTTRSKYRRRNGERYAKNRKRGSSRRANRRRKTKNSRRRTKQSSQSRYARYRPL